MNNIVYSAGPMFLKGNAESGAIDLCNALGVDSKRANSLTLRMSVGDTARVELSYYVEVPQEGFQRIIQYYLYTRDWRAKCIGCCHYRFGKYCEKMGGHIPETPWDFYCKAWEVADRNMILFRRFNDTT